MITAFIVLLAATNPHPTGASHWYPTECCSNRDCHPVSGPVEQLPAGGYRAEGIDFPASTVKPSRDGHYHACYNPDTHRPICFFVPLAV